MSDWPQIVDNLTRDCSRAMTLASVAGDDPELVLRRFLTDAIILGHEYDGVIEYAKNTSAAAPSGERGSTP